ncbi:L,D-transpeptidase [Parafrankia sp. FMc2]|uniref:L,D-transpeptidase n=1 Tax=Parafrankia sp. FMc2 TaxID=3233196 RepID=UPI0034D6C05E
MHDAGPGPARPSGPAEPPVAAGPSGPALTRRAVVLGGAAAVTLGSGVAALVLAVTRDGVDGPASPRGGAATSTGRPGRATGGAALTPIARLRGDSAAFDTPGGPRRGTVSGRWRGAPSALPVLESQPGWLRVRLAQRPNESAAWIRSTGAALVTSSHRIEIDLRERRLRLYDREVQLLDAPAGIGVDDHPTPAGEYFVAFFAPPSDPGYGDFVMVTSAHSTTTTDWDSSGDAVVAIHGPLGSEAAIGRDGAQVSHGCVRLQRADLARLRDVPAGSPITIRSGSTI